MSNYEDLSSRSADTYAHTSSMKNSLEYSGSINQSELKELDAKVDSFVQKTQIIGNALNTEVIARASFDVVPIDLKSRQDEFTGIRSQVLELKKLVAELKDLATKEGEFSSTMESIGKDLTNYKTVLTIVNDPPSLEDAIDGIKRLKESIPAPNTPYQELLSKSILESINRCEEKFTEKLASMEAVHSDGEIKIAGKGLEILSAEDTALIENGTHNALNSFESGRGGWLMMPANTERAKLSEPVKVGMGGVAMNGDWKIHFSIHPEDMAKAIPIIIRHIYDPSTPKADIKIATKALSRSPSHQIGKEAALIFSKETESSAEGREKISQFLKNIWKAFHADGIRPEPGKLATTASRDEILATPDGVQSHEKQNISCKKFNAQIAQPDGEEFFHYRFENVSVMDDESLVGVEDPRCLSYSQVDDLEDCYKHNPLKEEDFLAEVNLRDLP
ncbi:MAG: hypothetical protein ACI9S8_002827 [Chlamydiales bacterium]|jgi:hypothetical protein